MKIVAMHDTCAGYLAERCTTAELETTVKDLVCNSTKWTAQDARRFAELMTATPPPPDKIHFTPIPHDHAIRVTRGTDINMIVETGGPQSYLFVTSYIQNMRNMIPELVVLEPDEVPAEVV